MDFTSQKSTFQTYTNGTSPHIGEAANKEEPGYWYIGTTNTGVKAQGADALTMLLSNDSDIIVRNNLGVIVGDLPTTQVFALQGANQIDATFTETAPPNFEKGSDKHYTFENGLLTIKKIPDDFEGGTFTFTYSGISKSFSLKAVSSEVDYNLIIGQTLINTTNVNGEQTISITAKKVDSKETKIIDKNISKEVELWISDTKVLDDAIWHVKYQQGDTEPISIVLKISTDGGESWIEWDKETIEFVANGAPGDPAVAYWLQCSTPMISRAANGEYQTYSVTFTPMMQVGSGEPRVATEEDNIKVAIWKDQDSASTSGNCSGAQTIELVSKEDENIENNKYNVENALHCRMFFTKDGTHVQVDEQTAEVLADGVTITSIEYAVDGQGTNENASTLSWSTNYPETIGQGNYLWTKIIYSNGSSSTSTAYWPLDGTVTQGDKGDTAGTITLYQCSDEVDEETKQPIPPFTTGIGGEELGGWSDTALDPTSAARFVWKTNGTYTEDAKGENRKYGTSWTTPELHSAYYDGVSGSTAAEYYKLFGTDEDNQGMKFEKGRLYINASMINTGVLTITKSKEDNDEDSILFSAGWGEDGTGKVKLAGWEVTGAGLEKNVENDEGEEDNTYVGMYSGSDKKMAWPSLVSGGTSYVRFYAGLKKNDDGSISECNFAVLEDGSVYLQKAQVGGNSSLQLEEDKEPVEIASIFTTMSETQSLVEEFNEELSQNTVSELQSSVKRLTNNYTSIQETLLINLKPKSVETQSVGHNIYAGELQFKENV